MAVPKKGWRKITVADKLYYWRAIGTDWGIDGVVITDEAFVRGQSSQQLKFTIDYDHHRTSMGGGVIGLRQQAVISPGVVRLAIKRGLSRTSVFTGEAGKEDIILKGDVINELQEQAHTALNEKEM